MPNINVEFDDFNLDDIIEYVVDELKGYGNEDKLKSVLGQLSEDNIIIVKTLDDEMKYEHIAKVFHKYSTDHFEKQLPA